MNTNEKNIHRCDENWYDDIWIEYQKINVEQKSWVINYVWRAKEGDVEDGVAEKVGDIIMQDRLLISYCPFCGKKLTDDNKNTW